MLDRLDGALDRRLTAIVGAAGTGKSTLLAHWADRHRVVSHAAVRGESDAALLQALIDGLHPWLPRPEAGLVMAADRSTSLPPDDNPARSDALAAALCQHVGDAFGADEHVVVAVDDSHLLEPGSDAAVLLAAIVRHAPPPMHVVLAARGALPFPTGRLLVDGDAEEIGAAELAFTADEVAALFGDDGAAEDVLRRTGGWAAAVAFAARAVARRGSIAAGDDRPMFAYLAEEVLAGESAESLGALAVAAELPWITPALAEHLGLGPAGRVLTDEQLVNITVAPVANVSGAVAVTPLVLQVLAGSPATTTTPAAEVLGPAAAWYTERGFLPEALSCVVRQDDEAAIARFLSAHGAAIVAAGQGSDVLAALQLVGGESPHVGLALRVLWGETLQALGRANEAVERFASAVPATGPVASAIAWRLGALYYLRNDTDAAKSVLDRAGLDGASAADEAACLAWRSAIAWSRGDRDDAVELAGQGLERATSAGDDKALATVYTMLTMIARVDGDHVAHRLNYARALEHAERAKDLLQIVRIRCNNGSHLTEDGEYGKALAELDIATHLADLGGYGMFRGLCLTNRAEALLATGRLDEAAADLEAARAVFQQVAPSMDAYTLELLGEIYTARGDNALAVAAFEEAVVIAEAASEIQALIPSLTGLALVHLHDDAAAALAAAERAIAVEATVHHAKALVALGWVYHQTGDTDRAVALADRAVRLARERGERPALAIALELTAAVVEPERRATVLDDARALWVGLGSPLGVARVDVALAEVTGGADGAALAASAADTLDRLGAKRHATRARAIAAAFDDDGRQGLAVTVLGGFSVSVGGVDVATSNWQSKIARDLFKMLAINRGRPIHREVLIERLWPGEFGEKASNRLSVALSAIRNAVDPRRAEPGDFAVIADRDSVGLNVANVAVDVDQFLAEATRGQALLRRGNRGQGIALLRRAEARYSGDVLEEQPYADWALPLREEALAMYLSVASVLAAADTAAGDHESAARRYLRMTERDPYSEHAFLGAVASLRAAGHHGSAQRLYSGYVAKMSEIDVEPAMFPA